MLHVQQVPGSFIGARLVVRGHRISIPVSWKPINADHPCSRPAVGLCLRCQVAKVRRNDDQSGWKIGAQLIQMNQLLGMVVVGIAEDQAAAIREGHILCSTDNCGEEGVGNVRDDHPNDIGLYPA